MKINTKKFIRNILICVVAWLAVSYILNYAPGFKRDKFKDVINLIINDKNITEELKENIVFSDEPLGIYLSFDDIKNIFDKNIYYDKDEDLIVTTSNTKIASFKLNDNKMSINGVEKIMDAVAFKNEDIIYIPITELDVVYNIYEHLISNADGTRVLVIDELNSGFIKATVTGESVIKYKPRLLSKSIGKTTIGEEVACFYTTSKGWRLIRTESGILGYVKANKLDNEYIVRQDYNDEIKTAEITTSLKDGITLSLYNNEESTKIIIKTLFNLKENGTLVINEDLNEEDYTVWATISNKGLEDYTNEQIKKYDTRTELINTILGYISKYKLKGVNIDFNNVTNSSDFCRFIIELTPRLRDLGLTTNVVLNKSFEEKNIVGIVDYLITEKEQ